ncbi:hypothetical protein EOA23_24205 [Mesorhizobium sp. M2A.F.Ca.ET.042.01.1.1]|nr:hypothetical protein EOA23_24205 [Mesorhizobium sp. M2A.F.Ca.ET.042.01.1.1]
MTVAIPERIPEKDVKEIVRYRLTEEFSIFYEAEIDAHRFHSEFFAVADKIDEIIERESLSYKLRRLLIGGDPEVYGISIEIERIMINLERILSGYKERMSYVEKSFGEIINRENIERNISDVGSVPIERYLNIISILRDRHESSRANYTVILAAIVGAAAALFSSKIFW